MKPNAYKSRWQKNGVAASPHSQNCKRKELWIGKALLITAEIAPEQPFAPDLMNNLNALAEYQHAIMDK